MKAVILAALVMLTLSVAIANADALAGATPQQDQTQPTWTAGAAGWG